MSGRDIFISHAVADKALADEFVDLMNTAMSVTPDRIFCSSLEGLGISAGADFLATIKEQMQNPKIVIALITKSYLNSAFCLCELGAAWAMSHKVLPILVDPVDYTDVKAVLLSTNSSGLPTPEVFPDACRSLLKRWASPSPMVRDGRSRTKNSKQSSQSC